MHTRNDVARLLSAHELRVTAPRIAILSVLAHHSDPLSILEIAGFLKEKIDQVTVYRTIETLIAAQVLREVNLHGDKPRFELNDEHDHHHLVCTGCGRIEDFTEEAHEKIGPRVLARSKQFKVITGHSFDLYGLCKKCA